MRQCTKQGASSPGWADYNKHQGIIPLQENSFFPANRTQSTNIKGIHRTFDFVFIYDARPARAAAIARRPDPQEILGRPSRDPQGRVCCGLFARGAGDGSRPLVRRVFRFVGFNLRVGVRRRGWKSLARQLFRCAGVECRNPFMRALIPVRAPTCARTGRHE